MQKGPFTSKPMAFTSKPLERIHVEVTKFEMHIYYQSIQSNNGILEKVFHTVLGKWLASLLMAVSMHVGMWLAWLHIDIHASMWGAGGRQHAILPGLKHRLGAFLLDHKCKS